MEAFFICWEFGRPYLIIHDNDGYCVHRDRERYKCTVYEHRTVPCMGFRCQDNEKWQVWLDYEKKVINPELMEQIDESNVKIYSFPEMKLTSNSSTK